MNQVAALSMIFNDQDWSDGVTLRFAQGLARGARRCFAEFTLERSEGLSMTVPMLVATFHKFIKPVLKEGTLSDNPPESAFKI